MLIKKIRFMLNRIRMIRSEIDYQQIVLSYANDDVDNLINLVNEIREVGFEDTALLEWRLDRVEVHARQLKEMLESAEQSRSIVEALAN